MTPYSNTLLSCFALFQENKSYGNKTICNHPLMYNTVASGTYTYVEDKPVVQYTEAAFNYTEAVNKIWGLGFCHKLYSHPMNNK